MAGFDVDVNEIVDYEDLLIPTGKYQVEIIKAKAGTAGTGRPKFDFTLKILDSIPAGEEFDLESFEDPIEGIQWGTMYFPMSSDDKKGRSNQLRNQKQWIDAFEVEPESETRLDTNDFEGCIGGVVIVHEHSRRDNPESPIVARVKRPCKI